MVSIVWSEIEFLDKALSVRFVSFVLAFVVVVIVSLLAERKGMRKEGVLGWQSNRLA